MTTVNGFKQNGKHYEREIATGLKLTISEKNLHWQVLLIERGMTVSKECLSLDFGLEEAMQFAMKMGSAHIRKLASKLWEIYHDLSNSIICERCRRARGAKDEGREAYECTSCSGRYSYPELEF